MPNFNPCGNGHGAFPSALNSPMGQALLRAFKEESGWRKSDEKALPLRANKRKMHYARHVLLNPPTI